VSVSCALLLWVSQVTFGRPQLIAAVLLLALLLQCLWLMTHTPISGAELQHHTSAPSPSTLHSPLTSLLVTVPATTLRVMPDATSPFWWVVLRGAFTAIGLCLGAAVWYVARRLYGNSAGYIALALYCFSPAIVAHSSTVAPEIVAAFGAFGVVWTAVATAHTLYAPREVVLWNWKRIVLLGVAIALGVGAQFSIALLLLLALAFMVYLVPHRAPAAIAILAAGTSLGVLLIFAFYGFHVQTALSAFRHASWAEFSGDVSRNLTAWKSIGLFVMRNSPGLALLLAVSLVTFVVWPRSRYFGTSAPLITSVILVLLVMFMPRAAGFSFLIVMLPFALVFVAGICADLLEVPNIAVRSLSTGIIIAVLITHACFSLLGLRAVSSSPQNAPQPPHAALIDAPAQ
jgi:hypothetical protein